MSIFDWRTPLHPEGEDQSYKVALLGPPARGDLDDLGGLAPSWKRIDLRVQPQILDNWCWAACATTVAEFAGQTGVWNQCRVAETTLRDRSGCCAQAANRTKRETDETCDIPSRLPPALRTVNHDVGEGKKGRLPTETIEAELAADRPVAIRIDWGDGTGHFVLITGIRTGPEPLLEIEDPARRPAPGHAHPEPLRPLTLDALSYTYNGRGRWSHSYVTRRQ